MAYQVVHVVLFAWWTNLYNFMDGADGLAGGMSVFGFAAFAIAAFNTAQAPSMVAVISTTIAGHLSAFSPLTSRQPKFSWVMQGQFHWDSRGGNRGLERHMVLGPGGFGPAVFSAFITDATVTIVRRIMTGQAVWEAHREHYYQRLILWLDASQDLPCVLLLMLMSAFCALSAKKFAHPWTLATAAGDNIRLAHRRA